MTNLLVLATLLLGCGVLQAQPLADFGEQYAKRSEDEVDISSALAQDQSVDAKDLESLLHWAIEHSDASQLHKTAEALRAAEVVQDLDTKRQRVRELKHYLDSQQTDTDLIKELLAVLSNTSRSEGDHADALEQLTALVEPIDNANDLRPLGGIEPVAALLGSPSTRLRTLAAHVLGAAASNNAVFQRDLLAAVPDVLRTLLQIVRSASDEGEAVKALYAVSSLVRNSQTVRDTFAEEGGALLVEELLGGGRTAARRLRRKAVALLSDLLDLEPDWDWGRGAAEGRGMLASVVALLRAGGADSAADVDVDVVEKALLALQQMAVLHPKEVAAAGAEDVLRALQLRLETPDLAKSESEFDAEYVTFVARLAAQLAQRLASSPPPHAAEL